MEDSINETVSIEKPFEWLNDKAWEYLSDCADPQQYAEFDDMYRVILGDLSWGEYLRYGHNEKNIEEVKLKYDKEFQYVLANALQNLAGEILEGEVEIHFNECHERPEDL